MIHQQFCLIPILTVNAIFNVRRIYFALYQPSLLQLLQMLREGGPRYWQLFGHITAVTAFVKIVCKEIHNEYSCRVRQGLCIPSQLLLFVCIVFSLPYRAFFHFISGNDETKITVLTIQDFRQARIIIPYFKSSFAFAFRSWIPACQTSQNMLLQQK